MANELESLALSNLIFNAVPSNDLSTSDAPQHVAEQVGSTSSASLMPPDVTQA